MRGVASHSRLQFSCDASRCDRVGRWEISPNTRSGNAAGVATAERDVSTESPCGNARKHIFKKVVSEVQYFHSYVTVAFSDGSPRHAHWAAERGHARAYDETKTSLRNFVNASASSLTSMGFTRWTAKPEAALCWRSCGWP